MIKLTTLLKEIQVKSNKVTPEMVADLHNNLWNLYYGAEGRVGGSGRSFSLDMDRTQLIRGYAEWVDAKYNGYHGDDILEEYLIGFLKKCLPNELQQFYQELLKIKQKYFSGT